MSIRSSGTYSDDEKHPSYETILQRLKSKDNNLSFDDLGKTEQYLIDSLNEDSNVCLVCIETIGARDSIWSCNCCFVQFHISCILSWIKEGSYLNAINSTDGDKKTQIPWHCPKCRTEYQQSYYPSTYYCYCGKVKNPKYDPWILPHSCNQKCEKTKPCGHSCLLLCHPGPCPPCPIMVMNKCYCSKSSAVSRRCSNKNWSCNKECKRLLTCKQHYCTNICHPGDCIECNKTSVQYCQCKKHKKEVLCINTNWKCEEPCGRSFSCGYHKCDVVCHSEANHSVCPRSLQRSCPCGKSKIQKLCTEDIPTCGDTCDKLLNCNLHRCVRRCHNGSCEQCRQLIVKKCRCGLREKELACYVDFTCETKCVRMRNCGKHKCNKKCCDGNCSPCEQTCNKTLSCKNHKCSMPCHNGPCYPCPIQVEVSCACGKSKLKMPCGKSKAQIKVPCKELCKKPPNCHHETREPHRCHNSDCPPCKMKCSKQMKCGHLCEATCHSAVLTEVSDKKIRDGPWEQIKVEKKILNLECPPCKKLIKTECFGKHEITELYCHLAKSYCCGSKCGNMLTCSHHTCEFLCHVIERNKDGISINCVTCERPCEQPRPKGCEHECSKGICHVGVCEACKMLKKFKCHCGQNTVYVECEKWNLANAGEKDKLMSCLVPCTKNLKCGHQCTLLCHKGECSRVEDCKSKVTVKCSCKTIKKSFLCNQLYNKEVKKVECTEKCETNKAKKAKANETQSKQVETETDTKQANPNTDTNFNKFIILSIIILIISVFIYFYFM